MSLRNQFIERTPGTLSRKMTERTQRLVKDVEQAAQTAAAAANAKARTGYKNTRPNAPQRPGRRSTQGNMTRYVDWKANGGDVTLDVDKLNSKVPYWIIQEIGTGERANVRTPGRTATRGRPRKDGSTANVRTVKSQRGRRISAALAFGTGPRGAYTAPGAGRGQQLYLRRRLQPNTLPGKARGITIQREIQGRHFVRDSGKEGFRDYRTSVLSAARRAFTGFPYRP